MKQPIFLIGGSPQGLFQHGHGYEMPAWVSAWQWRGEYQRWSALVTFYDGWTGWSYPILD